jgi:hypothetical protein
MDTWTHGHMDTWTHGHMDTWTHGGNADVLQHLDELHSHVFPRDKSRSVRIDTP